MYIISEDFYCSSFSCLLAHMCAMLLCVHTPFYLFRHVCCLMFESSLCSRPGYVVKVRLWIMMKKIFDWHRYNRLIFALSVPLRIDSESESPCFGRQESSILV